MKHSDKMWVAWALGGVSLVGLLVMVCGLGLSMGYRTLSMISFVSVGVLLGLIPIIKKILRSRAEDSD